MAKKKRKIKRAIYPVTFAIIGSIYLIYNIFLFKGIEDLIRYIVIAGIVLFDVFLLYKTLIVKKKKRKLKKTLQLCSTLLLVLYGGLSFYLAYNINVFYQSLNNLNKDISKSTSLVTLKSNSISKIENIKDSSIGIVNLEEDLQAHQLPQEIINEFNLKDKNKIETYVNYLNMIDDLREENVDYIFLPTNYPDLFDNIEGYEDFANETKIVYTKSKKVSKKDSDLLSSSKKLTEPFTILLLGIDSTKDNIKEADSFNGDVLLLVSFNPKTLTATMLSIPRDTYVPIACYAGQTEDKINHSAAYGTKCTMNTIEKFTGIKVDYYMKINFTGVVDLVDALGGITVDVPYAFCEQNSKRRFGKNIIHVDKGEQVLNGEEALALSRNRKTHAGLCKNSSYTLGARNDHVRGENQQLVLSAMINQVKNIESISQAKKIMNTIENNIDTNMNTNDILSFYDVVKDIVIKIGTEKSLFTTVKLGLSGNDQMIYSDSYKRTLYFYVPHKESITLISNAMKENLGLKTRSLIKSFSYSYGENYKTVVIGKNVKGYSGYATIPYLTTYTKERAISWAEANSYKIIWEEKEVDEDNPKAGVIISQSIPATKRLDTISNKTITLVITIDSSIEDEELPPEGEDEEPIIDEEEDEEDEENDNGDGDEEEGNA